MKGRGCKALVFAILVLLAIPLPAQAGMKAIPLHHRAASEILPAVRSVLGPGESAVALDDRLIVKAEGKDLRAIEKMVRELDRERSTFLITVRQSKGLEEGKRVLSTEASGDGENVRGLGNRGHSSREQVAVTAGEQAFIRMGKDIPFTRDLAAWAGSHAAGVDRELDFQHVSTGFWVRPELSGDRVLLHITPQMSSAAPGSPGAVQSQSLGTSVEVPIDQWYNLGKILRSRGENAGAPLLLQTEEKNARGEIWIKVERR